MQEVNFKTNETGLRIFINGVPNRSLIPKDELNLLVADIETKVSSKAKQIRH